MKKVFEFLPLHFCVCVIVGIVLQFHTSFWQFGIYKLFLILSFILIFLLTVKSVVIRTFLTFILFIFIGISTLYINDDRNYEDYYKHHIKTTSSIILKVSKVLKPGLYHHKFEAEVVQVDSLKTKGKVLLNITKDTFLKTLKVDEIIYTKNDFSEIQKPLNPNQFDYKFYLEKQGIYQQLFLDKNQFKSLGFEEFSLVGLSAKFRNKIQNSLKNYDFKKDELAVINALLLGQRQNISKELIANYSKAGAIHILAVSGLHVGIILWILTWLLKPIERINKGKIIKIGCIVILLWMFAFVAGLSASVVRAVTMFTFLAIGLTFQRKNVIFFSLISSMFFLLVFNPMFLFDVGFQLSYLAVFGIVWIQPKLYKIYTPKYKLDTKIWEISTVSIAAQIGVLPLSLYYFHQFPGLFMLSNLIIIPFLSAILVGGILIISLTLFGILPEFLATIYGYVISLMNGFVNWISNQERFLFKEISLSFMMMLVSYAVVVFGIYFLIQKSAKRLIWFFISIFLIQLVFLFESHYKRNKNEFIIFHKSRNTIIGNRVGEQLFVNHDLDSLLISKTNVLVSYKVEENLKVNYKSGVTNIYKYKNDVILIVDSLGVYQLDDLDNPIVLLQQSPKINLKRLIKNISPKQIIADGSNYKSYVNRWRITCEQEKTPFHYTEKNGAYSIIKN